MHTNRPRARVVLLCFVSLLASSGLLAAAGPGPARVVTVKAGDDMKFDVTTITARPGEALQVKVTTVGKIPKFAMAHNFVLLTKGADAKAFADQAIQARATNFVPAGLKAQVLAATGLAGPGETVEVTFTAPSAPGTYVYICSFPGHYAAGMKGVLVVK